MSHDSAAILLKTLIDHTKMSDFTEDYRSRATDAQALGLLIARYFTYDGLAILETAYAALESANFHTENEAIRKMIVAIEGEPDLADDESEGEGERDERLSR